MFETQLLYGVLERAAGKFGEAINCILNVRAFQPLLSNSSLHFVVVIIVTSRLIIASEETFLLLMCAKFTRINGIQNFYRVACGVVRTINCKVIKSHLAIVLFY